MTSILFDWEALLLNKQADEVLSSILDPVNEASVIEYALQLIPVVGNLLRIKIDAEEFDEDEWQSAELILEHICKISVPKECFLGLLDLLEQANSANLVLYFEAVLPSLKICLLRMQLPQRSNSLPHVSRAIRHFLLSLSLPQNKLNLADDEVENGTNFTIASNPELDIIERCMEAVIHFCEPFVSETVKCQQWNNELEKYRSVQRQALLEMLFSLISKAGLWFDKNSVGLASLETIIDNINLLLPNAVFQSHLEHILKNAADPSINQYPIACLAYWQLAKDLCADNLPAIYHPVYVFETLISSLLDLMKLRNERALQMSLELLTRLTSTIIENSLSIELLDNSDFRQLVFTLINACNCSNRKSTRKLAYKQLFVIINSLSSEAQLVTILMIFDQADDLLHRGILGYLIDFYRSKVHQCLIKKDQLNKKCVVYLASLPRMISLFTNLFDGERTDFLDCFDQSMAALNLIRYLSLQVLNGTLSLNAAAEVGFCVSSKIFDRVAKDYLTPMRRGIDIAKAHYKLELEQTQKENLTRKSNRNNRKWTLDNATGKEKINVLKSAINSFDLLQNLLAIVTENIENFKQ